MLERNMLVIKNTWCGHVFTDDEKEKLYSGESVYLSDCVSRKGKISFKCIVSLVDIDGSIKIWPKFDE